MYIIFDVFFVFYVYPLIFLYLLKNVNMYGMLIYYQAT